MKTKYSNVLVLSAAAALLLGCNQNVPAAGPAPAPGNTATVVPVPTPAPDVVPVPVPAPPDRQVLRDRKDHKERPLPAVRHRRIEEDSESPYARIWRAETPFASQ